MTCSLSRMVETENGERVVTWLISLDFPGGYRERLKEPVRIGGVWEHYVFRVYDPAWAVQQGQYAYDYIEAELRKYVHYQEDWLPIHQTRCRVVRRVHGPECGLLRLKRCVGCPRLSTVDLNA